ncbi:hypothetical protein ASTA108788_03785 [Asticcacaulis taihuensis]
MSWFLKKADKIIEPSKEWDFYFCRLITSLRLFS